MVDDIPHKNITIAILISFGKIATISKYDISHIAHIVSQNNNFPLFLNQLIIFAFIIKSAIISITVYIAFKYPTLVVIRGINSLKADNPIHQAPTSIPYKIVTI